jgi:hypothetical protein
MIATLAFKEFSYSLSPDDSFSIFTANWAVFAGHKDSGHILVFRLQGWFSPD